MTRQRLIVVTLLVVLLAAIHPVLAGGWSVATLDHLPDRLIAGEPVPVGFVIRQHGNHVLYDLTPVISATPAERGSPLATILTTWFGRSAPAPNLTVDLVEDTPGHYTGELVFPSPGVWQWSISAFGPDQPLPALTVLPAGTPVNATATQPTRDNLVAQGRDLFVAKGCSACHEHGDSRMKAYASINRGPVLTNYTATPAFLRAWLSNPSAVNVTTAMPDLDLNDPEIDALIAFPNDSGASLPNP